MGWDRKLIVSEQERILRYFALINFGLAEQVNLLHGVIHLVIKIWYRVHVRLLKDRRSKT
jgi:hypothetical protein